MFGLSRNLLLNHLVSGALGSECDDFVAEAMPVLDR
jgi:hypothetical protein